MSGAIYRVRKRVDKLYDLYDQAFPAADIDIGIALVLEDIIKMIDEEIEADAEKQFTTSIKPVEFPK